MTRHNGTSSDRAGSRRGKTYTPTGDDGSSRAYFETVRDLVDALSRKRGGRKSLLPAVRRAADAGLPGRESRRGDRGDLVGRIDRALSTFTEGVEEHLRILPPRDRFDRCLETSNSITRLKTLLLKFPG